MNPLDFLNEAIKKVISNRSVTEDQERSLGQEYVGALLDPLSFLEKTRGVVEALNDRNRRQDAMIREVLNKQMQ